MAYLDKDGLAKLWAKIKAYVDEHKGITALDVYPVGAVYISLSLTSPATLFGGTWERITDCFLYASNATDSMWMGTKDGASAHNHTFGVTYDSKSGSSISASGKKIAVLREGGSTYPATITGVTSSASNMPPLMRVAVWQRTK